MNRPDYGMRVWLWLSILVACASVQSRIAIAESYQSRAPAMLSTGASLTGASELLQSNGAGASEFEAVKAASKQILATALSHILGRSATLDEPARRRLERDIEENFRQTRTRLFSAMDRQCEFAETVSCNVRAAVNMNELRSLASTYLDQAGANQMRVAMTVDRDGARGIDTDDALTFIHNALELQLGYDVYFVDTYVPLEELRAGCRSYESKIDSYRARGASFARTVSRLEAARDVCVSLLDREAVIIAEGISINVGDYDPGRGVLPGTIKPTIKFFRTDSPRSLPSPLPLEILKYGEGESFDLAVADLNNRMYQDVANYIGQQFSEIVLSRRVRGGGANGSVPAQSSLRITGVSRDESAGRQALQLVERWFADNHIDLAPQLDISSREEHVYAWNGATGSDMIRLTDGLRNALDSANLPAVVDIDRWQGLTVAFSGEQPLEPPEIAIGDRKIRKAFSVERAVLHTIRQDQATGVAMAVNVADLTLRNKHRRAYGVVIEPVWRDAGGTIIESEFNQRTMVRFERQSTRSLQFRAPSRAAVSVDVLFQCTNKDCE